MTGATADSSPVRVDPDRWRPTRAGLINVWQYTDEVLEFERGKMVLYGPNGSGKTMALELLLPHLLDARAQPARLSTSGSDRGGLWDRVTGYDAGEGRTGYLWLEFARPSGQAITLGVRLRAKPSGGGEKHWFTTPQRIGHDLALLQGGRPLSVEQLRAALEPAGKLWGANTAGYRESVRATLFPGWSTGRLAALIDTLLVIRKQNVSDGLAASRSSKKTNLSDLLTQALPPLDDLELGRVADGFADLDRRRDRIATLEADAEAVRTLADANRRYTRAVTARVVASVVQSTTAFDNVTRGLRQQEETLLSKSSEHSTVRELLEGLDDETEALRGESEAITNSEAFRDGAQIDVLRQRAESAAGAAEDATAARERSKLAAQRSQASLTAAQSQQAATTRQLDQTRHALHGDVEQLGGPLDPDIADHAVEGAVQSWVEERESAIERMRVVQGSLATARELLARVQAAQQQSEARLSVAERTARSADLALTTATKQWRSAVVGWVDGAHELGPLLRDRPSIDDPDDWLSTLTTALTQARDPLLERRVQLRTAESGLQSRKRTLQQDLEALLSQPQVAPASTDDRRDRSKTPGAPLWRVLDFATDTPPHVRGAVESALADCGLLDAWLAPNGELDLGEHEVDVLLRSSPLAAASVGEGLGALLVADPTQDRIEPAVVERLLGVIELVDTDANLEPAPTTGLVLGKDGTWRAAHRGGRAHVVGARYIGASARATERAARVKALRSEIRDVQANLDSTRADAGRLTLRLQQCEDERRAFPAPEDVNNRRVALAAAERDVCHFEEALQDARQRVNTQAGATQRQEQAVADAGVTYQLPTEPSPLRDYAQRLRSTVRQLAKFKERLVLATTARRDAHKQAEDAEHKEEEVVRLEVVAKQRRHECTHATSAYRATLSAHGTAYEGLVVRKGAIERRQLALRREQNELRHRDRALEGERGRLGADIQQTTGRRERAKQEREDTQTAFRQLCHDKLVSDAEVGPSPHAELLIGPTATLAAARHVRAADRLGAPVNQQRERTLYNNVMGKLAGATRQLAGRAELSFEPTELGWSVLRVRRDGVATPIGDLSTALLRDLQLAGDELSRKEQSLFEEILAGSVRDHLKDRMYSATALVDRINAILQQVESAAGGVRVQLTWEIDRDLSEAAELRRAKELLLHDSPIEPDRSELDAFLRQRIERVRSDESDTGNWQQRLAAMLDYRDWHRFEVLVHHNRFGDRPQRLQSRKVSLSAGEKTIVMVLPLIIAVAAHYEPPRGAPACISPRLLLMDELFPKLDFPNKRQLMGLLTTLDLDGVFTSDKDRCEYDTIDGIAIIVFRKLADDKTTTTRLVWNGASLEVDDAKAVSP